MSSLAEGLDTKIKPQPFTNKNGSSLQGHPAVVFETARPKNKKENVNNNNVNKKKDKKLKEKEIEKKKKKKKRHWIAVVWRGGTLERVSERPRWNVTRAPSSATRPTLKTTWNSGVPWQNAPDDQRTPSLPFSPPPRLFLFYFSFSFFTHVFIFTWFYCKIYSFFLSFITVALCIKPACGF